MSDDCGLQDDGSSDVVCSSVMDIEDLNVNEEEWEDDALCSLLSRHSHDVGHDLFRASRALERVQEVEVAACKYYSNTCQQVISTATICNVCNKAFAKSSYLRKHKRIHMCNKPYQIH